MTTAPALPLQRVQLEEYFLELERKLQLKIRVQRHTADFNEIEKRGRAVFEQPEDFRIQHLIRSLIKSGVPVDHVFDLVSRTTDELMARGFFGTTIDRVDLIGTVDVVLRSYADPNAREWAHEYHNRYGWEYEFTKTDLTESEEFIRTTDFATMTTAIQEGVKHLGHFPVLGAAGEADQMAREALEHDMQRIVRVTNRTVRASGLHTVSRLFVLQVACEVANWTTSPPEWSARDRALCLDRVSECIAEASKALTVEAFRDAERYIDEAVRLSVYVLAQRFQLWVGVFDSRAAAVVGRFADRLRVALKMRTAGNRGAQHKFYGGLILERLDEIGLPCRELLDFLSRVGESLRGGLDSGDKTVEEQLAAMRQPLVYAETLRNWVRQLVADSRRPPQLDADYFKTVELVDRQAALDKIVNFIVDEARLERVTERGHTLFVRLPESSPALSGFGDVKEIALVSIAAGRRDQDISRATLERRLAVAGGGGKVVICPNGFSADAKSWVEQDVGAEGLVLLVGAEALRTFIGIPTEFVRLLEDAAREKLVKRPLPEGVGESVHRAFDKAKQFAAEFHYQEAVHGLVVEFERMLSTVVRGWLLVTYGRDWAGPVKELTGRRSPRLDLGTCLTLLRSSPFRKKRQLWLERVGVTASEEVAALPQDLWLLLPQMIDVRNRSAHGAMRLYADDYKQFRDLFLQFLRAWSKLEYWPRLLENENVGQSQTSSAVE